MWLGSLWTPVAVLSRPTNDWNELELKLPASNDCDKLMSGLTYNVKQTRGLEQWPLGRLYKTAMDVMQLLNSDAILVSVTLLHVTYPIAVDSLCRKEQRAANCLTEL